KHYSQVPSRSGLRGVDAANELLRRQNIVGVRIEPIEGSLSDHYDPSTRTLRLSRDVYEGRSLAAIGVAAHEAGHAIQHAHDYKPLAFRSLVVRPALFGSNFGMLILCLGLAIHATGLIWAGIWVFSAFVLFTLVTLPVEFNASSRAIEGLVGHQIIAADEAADAKKVLDAAALTYVAAAISAVLQLMYFLMRAGLLGGRRGAD
ncbi:MAG TPA: zinc metallopeptidase, partial [Polyangiales bacterium]|nr:zinc metallopeptidase [Polyangiales bacterium]